MPEIKVYGQNDDLIEVSGDINAEFYANFNEPTFLEVLGYRLKIRYAGKGNWRIDVVESPEVENWKKVEAGQVEEPNNYTDVIRINQPFDDSVRRE